MLRLFWLRAIRTAIRHGCIKRKSQLRRVLGDLRWLLTLQDPQLRLLALCLSSPRALSQRRLDRADLN